MGLRVLTGMALMLVSLVIHANVNDEINRISRETEAARQSISPALAEKLRKGAFENADSYKNFIDSLNSAKKTDTRKGGAPADGAILFISFSMPDEAILQLASDAESYGIPVVIKGLVDGDFQKTLAKIFELQELAKKSNRQLAGIAIDPVWFEQFEIDAVPALVVTRRPADCAYQKACSNQPFDMVLGNVSIKKSLTVIAERGEHVPEIASKILEDHHA